MPILQLDLFSGLSGDMFLGALAPLLHAEADIIALPARLGLDHVEVTFTDVIRSTLRCRKATVTVHGHAPEAHVHDPHLHHHHHDHDHHHHPHDHHDHEHAHDHEHPHDHTHRAYTDIVALIRSAPLSDSVKTLALEMFRLLGEAEAEMHGVPLDQVHFHEVGGEDALIDLVGAALLIDKCQPRAVYATPVCTGSGTVRTAHGRLPVPAPATQRLLQGMPTYAGPVAKEMTTPTGAVILRALNPGFEAPPLRVRSTGMGAGTRDLPDQPNALRISLCDAATAEPGAESITLLQTNLDNLPAEDLGADLLADLIQAGAKDAWLTPILMKKGRPAHLLSLLCEPSAAETLSQHLLENLPTLGVRRFDGQRSLLPRSARVASTPFGEIVYKIHELPGGGIREFPEYESLRSAAIQHRMSVTHLRQALAALAE